MKPVEITILMRNNAKEGLKEISADMGILKGNTELASNVVKTLENQLASLEKNMKSVSPDIDQRENISMVEALKAKIAELKEELEGINNQVGKTKTVPSDLPGARKQYNGLHMSIQQIAREMPALAMGPQMFFMAISNNLPIFTDELARARKEYEMATAAGMKSTPVWKQVLKSLFSWQTGMTTLIMMSVMYGNEVWEWTRKLFNAEKAIRSNVDAINDLSHARLKGAKNAQSELVHLKMLYKASMDSKEGKGQQLKAIKKLQEQYPSYFGNLSAEQIMAGKATNAYLALSKAIIESAKARAYEDKIVENEGKILELRGKYAMAIAIKNKAQKKYDRLSQKADDLAGTEAGEAYATWAKDAKDDLEKQNKAVEDIRQQREGLIASNRKLSEEIKVPFDLIDTGGNGENLNRTGNEIPDYRVEAERKIQEQIISLMSEGIAKKKALADKEYMDEIARIDKEEKKALEYYTALKNAGTKVDPVEVKTLIASYDVQRNNAGTIYEQKINAVNTNSEKEAAKKRKEEMLSWDEYLAAYGNFIEKRDALQAIYNQKMAEAETQGKKASLKKQLEEQLKNLKFEELKSTIDFSQVFGNLDNLTTDSLSSLRDKLKEYINSAAKDLRPEDVRELSEVFQKIDFEIADRNPFSELKTGIDEYKSSLRQVRKAQQELADVQAGKAVVASTKYNAATGKIVPVLLNQKQAEENLNKAQGKRIKSQEKINAAFHSGVEKAREYVNAASGVLDALDAFGIEVPEELTHFVEGMGQTLDSLASIDVTKPMSIITGAIGAIGGIGTAIGGLFRKAHEVPQKMIEQYNRLIDTLDDVIAKHREMLREMAGSDATEAYEETRKLVDKQIAATQKMGTDYLNSNAKRSHTYGYKLHKELQGYANDFNKIGIDFESLGGRMEGLFKLSPEQLNTIKEQLPEVWSKLDDKTREYLESIIASSEAMDDLKDATDEALTGITFDAARDSLKNLLLDADATMSDVAEGFQNYMRQAIVNVIIDKNLKGQIEKWYEQFSEAMSDGVLSEQEKEELQKLYEGIYTDAANMRDNAYEAAGITNSDSFAQSARSGAVTTVTEETASKVEGIARSIQDHIAGMDEKMGDLVQVAHESFDQLWEINENTRYCRKLEQIADDIAEIKRDGLKTH